MDIDMQSLTRMRDESLGINPGGAPRANTTLADYLLNVTPGRLAEAEADIKGGGDIERGIRSVGEISRWADKNAAGLDTVIKAKTRNPLDAEIQKRALMLRTKAGLDELTALGHMELSATQTPADVIRIKIPGLINQAKETLEKVGDTDAGKKMMDEARELIKANEGSLRMATAYTGSNPLAIDAKKAATDLLSMKWYTDMLPMTDKRTNPAWTADQARKFGWSQGQKEVWDEALHSPDMKTRSVFQSFINAFGGVQADQQAKASRSGGSAGQRAAGAEAAGQAEMSLDPEAYFNYTKTGWREHIEPLGLNITGTQAAETLRTLAAVDIQTNGDGIRFATDAVKRFRGDGTKPSDQAMEIQVFRSSAKAFSDFTQAYAGDSGDVGKLRDAADAFKQLSSLVPPEAWNDKKAGEMTRVASNAGALIGRYENFSGSVKNALPTLTRALYKMSTNGELSESEQGLYNTVSSAVAMKSQKINRKPVFSAQNPDGTPANRESVDPDFFLGFKEINAGAERVLDALTANALAAGKTLTEDDYRAALAEDDGVAHREMTKVLQGLVPGTSDKLAYVMSKPLLAAWSATGDFDAATAGNNILELVRVQKEKDLVIATDPSVKVPAQEKKKAQEKLVKDVDTYRASLPEGSPESALLASLVGKEGEVLGSEQYTDQTNNISAAKQLLKTSGVVKKIFSSAFTADEELKGYIQSRVSELGKPVTPEFRAEVKKELNKKVMEKLEKDLPMIKTGLITLRGRMQLLGEIDKANEDRMAQAMLNDPNVPMSTFGKDQARGDAILSAIVGDNETGWAVKQRILRSAVLGTDQSVKEKPIERSARERASDAAWATLDDYDEDTLNAVTKAAERLKQKAMSPILDYRIRNLHKTLPVQLNQRGVDPSTVSDLQEQLLVEASTNPDTALINIKEPIRDALANAKRVEMATRLEERRRSLELKSEFDKDKEGF